VVKYPRTKHLQGSRIQPGDEDLDVVPFSEVKGRFLVVEEKIDGANCGISFDGSRLLLQSRGHYLTGHDHRQFDLLKAWAASMQDTLFSVLQNRYIMYGEWMFAKHTEFYDALPHYFLEFDIYDQQMAYFLGTQARHDLLAEIGIVSVPVLKRSDFDDLDVLVSLINSSKFKTNTMQQTLTLAAEEARVDPKQAADQTDLSLLMEGLYIKDETSGAVDARYKWVRSDFLQRIKDSGSHWMQRRIIPNQLAPGVDIFA
jgi:hypothetical protein